MTPAQPIVVYVPFHRHIEPETEESLRAFEREGYRVERRGGCADLALCRSEMATEFMRGAVGEDFMLFMDSDIVAGPEEARRLLGVCQDIVGGIIPYRDGTGYACVFNAAWLGEKSNKVELSIPWGTDQIILADRIATAFLLISRHALDVIGRYEQWLPGLGGPKMPVLPFFMNMLKCEAPSLPGLPDTTNRGDLVQMLSEDYSFCERARSAGLNVFGHLNVLPGHIGRRIFKLGAIMQIKQTTGIE